MVILLLSPILFILYNKHEYLLWLLIVVIGVLSVVNLFIPHKLDLVVYRLRMAQPLFFIPFFCLGFLYFTKKERFATRIIAFFTTLSLLLAILLALAFRLKVSYEFHTYNPDV
jgi:hypothetical protein